MAQSLLLEFCELNIYIFYELKISGKNQFLMLSISATEKSIMTGNSDLQNDFRGIDLFQDCTLPLFG